MKYLLILLLAISATFAADGDAKKAVESYYRANEFSVDVFGQVRTDDFNDERLGAGVGINYFYTQNWGIGLEGSAENTSGIFVEAARANIIYRIPINRSAIYVFAGAGANFCVPPEPDDTSPEDEGTNWAIDIGVGVEHRFHKHFAAFADVRLDKIEDRSATALARVGVRVPF